MARGPPNPHPQQWNMQFVMSRPRKDDRVEVKWNMQFAIIQCWIDTVLTIFFASALAVETGRRYFFKVAGRAGESFLAQIRQVALDPGGWHPDMPTIICCIRERSALVHTCGEFDVNARAAVCVGKDPLLDREAVVEDATVARQLPPILRYQVEHFIGPTIECIAGLVINGIDLVVAPHLGDHLGISAHFAYGDIMKGTLPPHGAASGRVARPPRA